MGAKQKLNSAHLWGALVIAGLVGLVTQSWTVFLVALTGVIVVDVIAGDIRR
jgi:hypothetical protein